MKRTTKSETEITKPGRVFSAVADLLRRQVSDRGIVVWYDPLKTYGELVKRLVVDDCVILRLEDGFFRLREQLEPFLECVTEDGDLRPDADIPPRVLVYVPLDRTATDHALIEAETAGTVVEPDAPTPERNSRLGRIVEAVFREIAPAKAEHLARQADEGLLTVEELDRMAGEAGATTAGALQVIFGPVSAEEMLLQFAAVADRDADLEARSAVAEIAGLLRSELGLEMPEGADCRTLRAALVRHMLLGDLLIGLGAEPRPEALSGMEMPRSPSHRDTVARICRQWRNRTDLKDAYARAAEQVERDLDLQRIAWQPEPLRAIETFPFAERVLLEHSVELFLHDDAASAAGVAAERGSRFWPSERPAWQLAWRVVESAGGLAQTAGRVQALLRQRKWLLDELIEAYALHADPWMRLDRQARDLEARHARWEAAVTEPDRFETLLARARETYAQAAGAMAEAYANALRQAAFRSERHAKQSEVFPARVAPGLEGDGKAAYFLVDALRYEMAAELLEGMGSEFSAELTPALGSLPGITPVGMAALLPGAEEGIALKAAPHGIDVAVKGSVVTGRAQRLQWLAAHAGVPTCSAKLADTLKPAFRRRKDFQDARLVVVTSQEIDLLGEEGDEEGVRLYLVDVLEKLRRAVRLLARAGVDRFIIAADHGFLYTPGLDPGMAMDAPGGETKALHARAWIGAGGKAGAGFFRVKAAEVGLQSAHELAFPLGLGSFRMRGGNPAYVHGGISPPEMIVPIVRLTSLAAPGSAAEIVVRLSLSKPVITNRLFSATIEVEADGLFSEEGRRVRFEVLSGRKPAGRAVAAAYGFEDGAGEVEVKAGSPNVVTFMLNADAGAAVTIRALDCRSQLVLDTLKDVPVELSIP